MNNISDEEIQSMAKKIHALGDKALELCDNDPEDAQYLLELTTFMYKRLKNKDDENLQNLSLN